MNYNKKQVVVVERLNAIFVYFEFDYKTVAITKKIGGGHFSRNPENHWEFPKEKRDIITKTYKDNGYYVTVKRVKSKEDKFPTWRLGVCRECGRYRFISEWSGLCDICTGGGKNDSR